MLVQIQEQKQKVKLSQILKNATEEQCFGQFMKISEITDLDEDKIIFLIVDLIFSIYL